MLACNKFPIKSLGFYLHEWNYFHFRSWRTDSALIVSLTSTSFDTRRQTHAKSIEKRHPIFNPSHSSRVSRKQLFHAWLVYSDVFVIRMLFIAAVFQGYR